MKGALGMINVTGADNAEVFAQVKGLPMPTTASH
jgi:hypothetical protein